MKILNFALAAMFLLFAFYQVDDPDSILWIIIYGGMAVVAVLAMFNVYFGKVILAMIVLFIGYSITRLEAVKEWTRQEDMSALFDEIAKMDHVYIEESREFLGLWICILVLIFYYVRSRLVSR